MQPAPFLDEIPKASLDHQMAALRAAIESQLAPAEKAVERPMKSTRGTIAVDFDGVIHSYTSPWTKPEEIRDPIVDGAIAFLLSALGAGCNVVIYSTRAATGPGRRAIAAWLRDQAGSAWWPTPAGPGIESVTISAEKPPAIVYIDDRAWRFDGSFPAIADVLAFKPWNRQ